MIFYVFHIVFLNHLRAGSETYPKYAFSGKLGGALC